MVQCPKSGVLKEEQMLLLFEYAEITVVFLHSSSTKKSQTSRILDFRPISLVTSLYKIIAKVLSGWLHKALQDTIFMSQGAFVKGRQILDAILITNELVDEKRRSNEEGVVFKIDFEKVYNHVDWYFLDHLLEQKGFSSKWRSWMRGCLSFGWRLLEA